MTGLSIKTITTGLTDSNALYKASSAWLDDAVDQLEDVKVLNTLRRGSEAHNIVNKKYMEARVRRKKRKRLEQLAKNRVIAEQDERVAHEKTDEDS